MNGMAELQTEQEKIHAQLRKASRLNEQNQLIDGQIKHTQQEIDTHTANSTKFDPNLINWMVSRL